MIACMSILPAGFFFGAIANLLFEVVKLTAALVLLANPIIDRLANSV
jgi:hypothetical protein